MRASPRADDMRPRPRRAAGLPEVQEGWQAPGCNAAPACPALAPAAAAGKLNAKLKSDFRCYPNNGHAATASAGPFCAKPGSLPSIPHHALAGVAARDIGELAFEGRRSGPAA